MSVYRHPEHNWQPLMEKVIATHEWGLHIGLQALPKFTQDLPLSKLISELPVTQFARLTVCRDPVRESLLKC